MQAQFFMSSYTMEDSMGSLHDMWDVPIIRTAPLMPCDSPLTFEQVLDQRREGTEFTPQADDLFHEILAKDAELPANYG